MPAAGAQAARRALGISRREARARRTDEDALRRELREELGVELLTAEEVAFEARDPGSAFVVAFIPVTVRGTPAALEHAGLHWGAPQTIAQLLLAPSDQRFLEYYRNRL